MNNEDIQKEIKSDETIERILRIIHQQIIHYYQQHEIFNKEIEWSSDLKKDEKRLADCVDKLITIKNVCVKELTDFSQRYSGIEKNEIIAELHTMIEDLKAYTDRLNFIIAKIINNNTANKEKFQKEIKEGFDTIFTKYNHFISVDKELIARLMRLEVKDWKRGS